MPQHGNRAAPPDAEEPDGDRSRANLGVEQLDLVQLHCPPDGVYEDDVVFDALDEMVDSGRIRAYGFSVETCAQALSAIARPHVATVQIILNCFRLKPLEQVLPAAAESARGGSRNHRPRTARVGPAVGALRRENGLRAGGPP